MKILKRKEPKLKQPQKQSQRNELKRKEECYWIMRVPLFAFVDLKVKEICIYSRRKQLKMKWDI